MRSRLRWRHVDRHACGNPGYASSATDEHLPRHRHWNLGVKALAINAEGEILSDATQAYPISHPKPLWSEQDPQDWWDGTVKVVRRVVKQAKLKKADVRAIGLSGQMHGSVFLDRAGKVIRPAILWNDQRTAAECGEIEKLAGGRKALIRMVANPALTGFTAPKILWLRNHEPRNFDRTRSILLPKDDIRRRLTGEHATEVSDASGTLLLDVAKRTWSRKLLSRLDLDADLLPQCYESEDVTGRLTSEAAQLARPDDGLCCSWRRRRLRRECDRDRRREEGRAVHVGGDLVGDVRS